MKWVYLYSPRIPRAYLTRAIFPYLLPLYEAQWNIVHKIERESFKPKCAHIVSYETAQEYEHLPRVNHKNNSFNQMSESI